jgi:acetyl-CoA carboxylase biotin carboxyl carrier protein
LTEWMGAETTMDFDELKQILDLIREHHLTEFELEREGFKIRIKKDGISRPAVTVDEASQAAVPAANAAPSAAPQGVAPAVASPALAASAAEQDEVEFAVVKSPIVGTFYRAPEQNAPPFVKVGDIVKKGQVLCIIEAMKLMNEIDSEYDGEIVKVYVENGQSVQYGERLFAIRTHAE